MIFWSYFGGFSRVRKCDAGKRGRRLDGVSRLGIAARNESKLRDVAAVGRPPFKYREVQLRSGEDRAENLCMLGSAWGTGTEHKN